jgi:hypothetical protein
LKRKERKELNRVFQAWVRRVQEVSEGKAMEAPSDDKQVLYIKVVGIFIRPGWGMYLSIRRSSKDLSFLSICFALCGRKITRESVLDNYLSARFAIDSDTTAVTFSSLTLLRGIACFLSRLLRKSPHVRFSGLLSRDFALFGWQIS